MKIYVKEKPKKIISSKFNSPRVVPQQYDISIRNTKIKKRTRIICEIIKDFYRLFVNSLNIPFN